MGHSSMHALVRRSVSALRSPIDIWQVPIHESSASPRPRRGQGRRRRRRASSSTGWSPPTSTRSRRAARAMPRCSRRRARSSPISSSSKAGRRRRRLLPRLPARAGADAGAAAQFLQAARQGDRSRICRRRSACWRSGTAPARTEYGPRATPTRACPRSGSRCMLPPHLADEAAAELGADAGRCRRLRGAPHRARRAARRLGLHLRRRVPARGRHGPARRRRLRQGLLRRPGGGVAHGASRHRAHPRRAGRASRARRRKPACR